MTRVLELATQAAKVNHCAGVDRGHAWVGDYKTFMGFDVCGHPDCVLVRSALREPAGTQEGWQPIETAPECESILVFYPQQAGRQKPRVHICDEWLARNQRRGWRATHWMPLPAGPASLPEGQKGE